MQTTRRLAVLTVLAAVLIAAGALFLIAPVWLPGLGPRKAAALVAYREAHGPFATLADAAAVKGISLRMTESWAGLAAANH